jgi:hypothetical protein
MNLFNRIVVIFLLLALIPIITVGLIVPREAVQLLRDGLDQFEGQLGASVSTGRLVVSVGLALLIDGLLIFLLYLQVRRPGQRTVPVQQVKGGQAQVAVSSIVDRLVYRLDRLPEVLQVKPKVSGHRRGVEVVLDVETAAKVNMPAMVEEISALTRRVVEDELGLRLKGKPRLNLRAVSYPEPIALGEAAPPDVEADVGEPVFAGIVGGEMDAGAGNE